MFSELQSFVLFIKRPPHNMDLLKGKRPRKDIENFESAKSTSSLLYAGERENKYRFSDIVRFKQTGKYPDNIANLIDKSLKYKRTARFLVMVHNYFLAEEDISNLSKSRLCFKDEKKDYLLVIPFNSELPSILKALHMENEEHLGREKTLKRAKIYKIKWPGHFEHIRAYIRNCKCSRKKSS